MGVPCCIGMWVLSSGIILVNWNLLDFVYIQSLWFILIVGVVFSADLVVLFFEELLPFIRTDILLIPDDSPTVVITKGRHHLREVFHNVAELLAQVFHMLRKGITIEIQLVKASLNVIKQIEGHKIEPLVLAAWLTTVGGLRHSTSSTVAVGLLMLVTWVLSRLRISRLVMGRLAIMVRPSTVLLLSALLLLLLLMLLSLALSFSCLPLALLSLVIALLLALKKWALFLSVGWSAWRSTLLQFSLNQTMLDVICPRSLH